MNKYVRDLHDVLIHTFFPLTNNKKKIIKITLYKTDISEK